MTQKGIFQSVLFLFVLVCIYGASKHKPIVNAKERAVTLKIDTLKSDWVVKTRALREIYDSEMWKNYKN
jgi:hypothetical protein